MTILERYIFKRAFTASMGALAALVLIVWIVQVLQRVDIVRTTATAAGNVFWIALMLMPDLASGVLPFALLIGSVQALNALNADSERAVIAAAGASRAVLVKPILLLGLLAAGLTLFNSNVVGPAASSAFQNGIRTVNADAISLFLQPGRFEQVQDGVVLSIAEARGSNVKGLFISDTRDPDVDVTYFAREANIIEQGVDSYLVLDNGQLHRRTVADGAVSIVEFQTYAFDLSNLRPVDSGDWVRLSERSTRELLNPDPNDRFYQKYPNRFTEELSQRRTDWLFPIGFTLWALVVASHPRTNRQGSGGAMTLGMAGGLILKALGFVFLSMVDTDPRLSALVYLLPAGAVALNLWLLLRNVNLVELPVFRRIGGALRRFAAGLRRLAPAFPAGERT